MSAYSCVNGVLNKFNYEKYKWESTNKNCIETSLENLKDEGG